MGVEEYIPDEAIKNLRLEGLLVYTTIPTEDIYKRRFELSHLSLDQINSLIAELEELFNGEGGVDEEYSKRETKERNFTIKRRNKRVERNGRKVRVEVPELEFYVVPHRIANWMKRVRSLYYILLNKYAIKIPLARWEGREEVSNTKERNLYLIPENMVSDFLTEFDELNRIYDDIHSLVLDYAYSPYLEKLNAILEKYELPPLTRSFFETRNPHAQRRIMSMEMTPETMRKWAKMDPRVAEEIRRQTAEMVKSAVAQLRREIQPLLENIEKNIEKWMAEGGADIRMQILEDIETIQMKAEYLGLGRLEGLEKISGVLRGEVELEEDDISTAMWEVDERITSFVDKVNKLNRKVKGEEAIKKIDKGGLEL